MAQNAPITLTDAQTTPVVHTLNPTTKDGLVAKWRDSDSGVVVGLRPSASISLRPGKLGVSGKPGTKRKVSVKITVPYQPATVGQFVPPIEVAEAFLTFMVAEDAPLQVVKDLEQYSQNIGWNAQISDVIIDGAFPY